jgi:hypothetical protein
VGEVLSSCPKAARTANDLSDVAKAISVAARLMGEKLDQLEAELLELIRKEHGA